MTLSNSGTYDESKVLSDTVEAVSIAARDIAQLCRVREITISR